MTDSDQERNLTGAEQTIRQTGPKLFRAAALQGNADGQYGYGASLFHGLGVDQDLEAGVYWYRQAAERGHPCALRALANCYKKGIVVERNEEVAASLYREAVKRSKQILVKEIAGRSRRSVSSRSSSIQPSPEPASRLAV